MPPTRRSFAKLVEPSGPTIFAIGQWTIAYLVCFSRKENKNLKRVLKRKFSSDLLFHLFESKRSTEKMVFN